MLREADANVSAVGVACELLEGMTNDHDHDQALQAALAVIDDWNGDIGSFFAEPKLMPSSPSTKSTDLETTGSEDKEEEDDEEHEEEDAHQEEPPVKSNGIAGTRGEGAAAAASSSRSLKTPSEPKKKKKTTKKCTVTRRKEEIRELRATVESLSAVLAYKQQHAHERLPPAAEVMATDLSRLWEEIATRQYSARRKAEMETTRLRNLLANLRVPPLARPPVHRRVTPRGWAVTISAPSEPSRWSSALEAEQLRHVEILAAQTDSVLASARSQYELKHSGDRGDTARHVSISPDGYGGTIINIYTAWRTPFATSAVADQIWSHPARTTCMAREDVTPTHRTMYSECVKTVAQNNQLVDTFRGKSVSRYWKRATDTIIVTTVTGRPSPVSHDTVFSNVVVRGEDWLCVRPVVSLSSSSEFSQIEWCRRAYVTSTKRPLRAGVSPAVEAQESTVMQQLVEEMAGHLVDDVHFCQQAMESKLLLAAR